MVIDGVSFVTADTYRALKAVTRQLKPGGVLLFSLTNVWGRFWWFGFARRIANLLGGDDFHKRAVWGRRLFLWTRGSQEGTAKTAAFYRSDESWAYDWFGPPAYHLHSPAEIRRWLDALGLQHLQSVPGLLQKDPPVNRMAKLIRALTGDGAAGHGMVLARESRTEHGSRLGDQARGPVTERARVETSLQEVYGYCPPTLTRFAGDGRAAYEAFWRQFMSTLGLTPDHFSGHRVLDVGCGSCEKTVFYHDWGADVTGVEMTPAIAALARESIGTRAIRLIQSSLFELQLPERFDIVISDGVLHHTHDTYRALDVCARHVDEGGWLLFGLVNVWGRFWWFKPARLLTRVLGGHDFHARARWGQRLFGWTRGRHEHAGKDSAFSRSVASWAYDWFGNPRWNAHTPAEIVRWLDRLGFDHVASIPSVVRKPDGIAGETLKALSGDGPQLMWLAWLLSGQPNMVYVCARRRGRGHDR